MLESHGWMNILTIQTNDHSITAITMTWYNSHTTQTNASISKNDYWSSFVIGYANPTYHSIQTSTNAPTSTNTIWSTSPRNTTILSPDQTLPSQQPTEPTPGIIHPQQPLTTTHCRSLNYMTVIYHSSCTFHHTSLKPQPPDTTKNEGTPQNVM